MRNPEVTPIDKRSKETYEVEEMKQSSGLNGADSLAETKSREAGGYLIRYLARFRVQIHLKKLSSTRQIILFFGRC
ncbi:hypothetical protein D7Z54_00435 [Salibacterium salarium]|uniref:Uncharacterized protein n=1 Tax=Salibacterium salarium TaxID=284579 RepID=A0A3R9QNZ8_9BACI|nr:hypothetical protein D7Z54_00435 [Salibacterium salarium]